MKNIKQIIKEEIENLTDKYIYHGTSEGATFHIQKDGRMRLNAANNNEPFISFTSKMKVANYYATMKGGRDRGVILRTIKTPDFKLTKKFKNNDGFEYVTTREIPIDELQISTKFGWIPLKKWDIIDKKVISEEIENLIENYYYSYNCVSPESDDELEFIIDNMVEISADLFLKNVSLSEVNNSLMYGIKYQSNEQLKKDWSVHFYKIKKNNIDAYILKNSAIEYIFKKE
jgi:hypothetical protein